MTPVLAAGGFSWFKLIGLPEKIDAPSIMLGGAEFGGPIRMDPIYHSIFAVFILSMLAMAAKKALLTRASGAEGLVPDDKLTARNFFEMFCGGLMSFLEPMLGKHTKTFFALIGTLFLYILVCNVLGLVPGFQPATADINSNIGMAVMVFVIYNLIGIKEHGLINYLKHFGGPVLLLAPLMFVIEVVSHLSRPLSLSVRLYGNMSGDHTVFETFMNLSHGVIVPIIFLALGLFVCLIQALVFTLLTAVYLSMAVAHDEEGAH